MLFIISSPLSQIHHFCDLSNDFYSFYSSVSSCAGRGQGNSKKQAEHDAAVKVLLELKKVNALAWPSMYLTPKLRPYPSFQAMPQPGQQNALLLIEAGHTSGNRTAEYYDNKMAHDTGIY